MYHLVPIELLDAVAETRAHGDQKYAPGNWMNGDRAFFVDCLNHAIGHLYAAADLTDQTDIVTHLGHAACNIAFDLWALKRGIIRREDFLRAAVIGKEKHGETNSNIPHGSDPPGGRGGSGIQQA